MLDQKQYAFCCVDLPSFPLQTVTTIDVWIVFLKALCIYNNEMIRKYIIKLTVGLF